MAGMLRSHIRVPRRRLQHCTPNRVLHHASRLTINATEQQACCPALAWDCAGDLSLAPDKNLTSSTNPMKQSDQEYAGGTHCKALGVHPPP